MINLRVTGLLICLILVGLPVAAQKTREISKKEREVQKLRDEIQAYEKKLKESEKKEKSTLDRLDNLERQSNLIRELIRRLSEEEERITNDIHTAKNTIDELEGELKFLKSHYAGYVRSVYKNGRVYDLELLFSSKSINQLYIRIEYLKRFSNQRAQDLREIVDKKTEVEEQNDRLQKTLDNERRLLVEKRKEEKSLTSKMTQRQQVLGRIRKDKKTYRQELQRKTEAVRQIEQLIADLIEKERVRREAERKKKEADAARERERRREKLATNNVPPQPSVDIEPEGTFGGLRGRLRWPVSSGVIASRFGNQIHPVLKTVTQNSGIDISVNVGTNVLAVAEGEVSVLSFIPGYGNVLILNHYDGYRSVYAHLSEIHVVEAQKVKEGEVIGTSGDSIGGSILHFELWKEREKMNPETWLMKSR